MKNGLLIWNVLLTVVAGYLLITQLGSKKNAGSGSIKSAGGDSAQMRMDNQKGREQQYRDGQGWQKLPEQISFLPKQAKRYDAG
jgi:hypothetical protein